MVRVLLVVALAVALLPASGGPASANHDDCRLVLGGVSTYAGAVFPSSRIECDTVKSRIRIHAELTRDGVVVSSERRDCRNMSVCHLTVDAAVSDIPGDQQY
ncbi:MAG: hypothetical protein ACRDHK_00355, partial [Actinomycetota bacterium]